MLVATFNCNSVRQRMGVILEWLEANRPDCLALQETKVADAQFPAVDFASAGWKVAFRGEKSYNGVAMITRVEPESVSFGLGDGDGGASETRLAHIRLGGVDIVNTYVPQGRALDSPSFAEKLAWLERFRVYLAARIDLETGDALWVGDLNVAPAPIDVYDHDKIWPHVAHCQEVIDAFDRVTGLGFVDVVRKHLPGEGVFTFWDYRMPWAVKANQGWRIDHVWATPRLAARSAECRIDVEPRTREKPSDHTFVAARFEL
jgi:exodeoxyribonuclease-3